MKIQLFSIKSDVKRILKNVKQCHLFSINMLFMFTFNEFSILFFKQINKCFWMFSVLIPKW